MSNVQFYISSTSQLDRTLGCACCNQNRKNPKTQKIFNLIGGKFNNPYVENRISQIVNRLKPIFASLGFCDFALNRAL